MYIVCGHDELENAKQERIEHEVNDKLPCHSGLFGLF